MILNIIILYIYIFFCIISVLGYGVIFSNYFLKSNKANFGQVGILGFFLLLSISIFLHFFINLSPNLNLFLLLIGFIIGLKNINLFYSIRKFKFYFTLIFLIFLFSVFSLESYADYEWYHLPYVNYLSDFKIIFGLVNISHNYVYGHGWLDIMGVFNLPIIGTKGLTALPIIFYFYFITFFIYEFYNNREPLLKIISLFIMLISLMIFNRLKDFGADIQPSFTLFILIFYIFKFYFQNKDKHILKYIILFFFYSCVLRIGSAVSLPIFFIFFIFNLKKYFQDILIFNTKLYIFLTLFLLIFISKNFITTGCIFYPIPSTCFSNNTVVWANPIENVEERYEFLSAVAKRWKFYAIEEGKLDNQYEYYEQILNNKIMSHKEYNSNKFYWLQYFFYDHDYNRIFNILIFTVFFLITFYLTFKKEININKKCIDFNIKYISLSVICAIIFWLFTSPQMRYGGYSIISAFLMIIIIFFLRDKNFEQKKFKFISNIFLLIAISYFAYKNIYTSTNDYLNNHFVNFPWPNIESKVENVDYYSKNYNGITVNFITKNDDDHLGSPKTCGNVKMPCLASGRKTCISDLYSKFNYLFIINKNKECLEHFKRNYWQY